MVLDENVHLLFTVVIIFFTCLIEALHFSFVEIIFQMLSLIMSLCYLYQMSKRFGCAQHIQSETKQVSFWTVMVIAFIIQGVPYIMYSRLSL